MAQDVLDLAGTGPVLGQASSHGVAQGVVQCSFRDPGPDGGPVVGLADQALGSSPLEPLAVTIDEEGRRRGERWRRASFWVLAHHRQATSTWPLPGFAAVVWGVVRQRDTLHGRGIHRR
jgi:hypothetical protein